MAWEEAAAHYERAVPRARSAPEAYDLRADALAGLGRARLLAGDERGAARAFDELAGLGRALGSAELLARAALGFSADLSGFEVRLFDQRQIDLLEEAARALASNRCRDCGPRCWLGCRWRCRWWLPTSAARRWPRRRWPWPAVGRADRAGRALAAHCDAIAGPDDEDREAEATEIIAIAEAAARRVLELLGRRLRYVARLEQGDVAGVEEDIAAFARRAETVGNPLYSWYVPLWQAQLALVAGDIAGAEALLAEVDAGPPRAA